MTRFDVLIIGAGASGMMCAIHAARRGRHVLVLDHSKQAGSKILISGGGHCNFTNTSVLPTNYVSNNPHFCKSALSRYPSEAFTQMVRDHGIAFHERKFGQLFCDSSAENIVNMLKSECDLAKVKFEFGQTVKAIERNTLFRVSTEHGQFECESLVIATGGLSFPKIGASGFGYEVARQFGHEVVPTAPALGGFLIPSLSALAGISLEGRVSAHGISFKDDILFTHQGMSGPAALQASLYWDRGDSIEVDFLPDLDVMELFLQKKKEGNRGWIKNLLGELIPGRLADYLLTEFSSIPPLPLPQVSEKSLRTFCEKLHHWTLTPQDTVGYERAEVTRGGVATNQLSSKTMESKLCPGLYFVGEVLDVTGWLGGYNLHWAWASGWAAGQSV